MRIEHLHHSHFPVVVPAPCIGSIRESLAPTTLFLRTKSSPKARSSSTSIQHPHSTSLREFSSSTRYSEHLLKRKGNSAKAAWTIRACDKDYRQHSIPPVFEAAAEGNKGGGLNDGVLPPSPSNKYRACFSTSIDISEWPFSLSRPQGKHRPSMPGPGHFAT